MLRRMCPGPGLRSFDRRSWVGALIAALLLTACGAASHSRTTPLADRAVNRESFADVRREYLVLASDDPARVTIRDRLLHYLAEGTDALIRSGDYEAVVARLGEMTELLSPIDLVAGGHAPDDLAPLARFVIAVGAPRGDEARVLASLLLLSRIDPDATAHIEAYERASVWGHDARMGAEGETRSLYDSLQGGMALVEVWEEHARLSPAPEVIDRLARLHVELRDRLTVRGEMGFTPPRSMEELEAMSFISAVVERAPLEVAAAYLRVGDLALARSRVAEMGDESGTEWRVRRILDEATRDDAEGVEALLQLAVGFSEARPDVALAVCRNGRRRFPNQPDFPICLARLSADRPAEAASWYAEAARLAPSNRDVYDDSLAAIGALLAETELSDVDASSFRMLVTDTRWLIEERNTRWPGEPAELTVAMLQLALAEVEAGAGNVTEARAALEQSLELDRSADALLQLADLELATSHPDRAAVLYDEALAALTDQSETGRLRRGLLFHELGDARRLAGDAPGASRAYRQALDALSPLADTGETEGEGNRAAMIHVELAALSRRLGDRTASDAAMRTAMHAAPGETAPFATILQTLVVDGPDATLAAEAFHGARVGSSLAPPWKVYFALWAQMAAERAGAAPDPEILDVLAEHATADGWHGRLAALGSGMATEEDLLAAATTPGERCEAYFYSGARLLAAGDRSGAERAFRDAVGTGMLRYYEYGMALELLAQP